MSIVNKLVDVKLAEKLSKEFGVEYLRARNTSREQKLGEFSQNLKELEGILGKEYTREIIEKGDFLSYKGRALKEYLRVARILFGKIRENPDKSDLIKNFYSLDSIYRALKPDAKKEPFEISNSVKRNRLLHSGDYLRKLAEDGEIVVAQDEHWRNGKRVKGARGLDIIRAIGNQLVILFKELKIGKPKYTLNHGQRKLVVDEETREKLKEIKEKNLQNKY